MKNREAFVRLKMAELMMVLAPGRDDDPSNDYMAACIVAVNAAARVVEDIARTGGMSERAIESARDGGDKVGSISIEGARASMARMDERSAVDGGSCDCPACSVFAMLVDLGVLPHPSAPRPCPMPGPREPS